MQRLTDSEQVTNTVHIQVTPQQLRNIADKLEAASDSAPSGVHFEYPATNGMTFFYEKKQEIKVGLK